MTERHLETGSWLDGFLIGEQVAHGGMGGLYRVTRPGLERELVMKVPSFEGTDGGEGLVGFETETMILPAVHGPHVPVFVAAGDLTQVPYLVLEWIDGQTLEARLDKSSLDPAEVADIGARIADAIHSVHQQGVIHLDLKPANIMLRPDGSVVLIDFGLAHHVRFPDLLAEETRFRAGSAPYVSPEQLLGRRTDLRSDLFSLGVTLYEALTGRLPFGEPDTDLRNRFWLDPEPPRAVSPSIPPWLQEVVLRALEPRAELRYQSAAHVAFDLRHPEQVAFTERAAKARRAGYWAHLRRFLRARAEYGGALRSPAALVHQMPIVMVAVDTTHLDDERHPAIYSAIERTVARSPEYRVLCLAVIPPGASIHEHLIRLRHWTEPLQLPIERLTLHAVTASSPPDAIVQLATHNNVDLIVLGAPSQGGRAWSQSVASTVAAQAKCSVQLVRARQG